MSDLRLANVQALRGMAALLVFLFHSRHLYDALSGTVLPLQWIANAGYIGVDLFFAISGFIMWHTCRQLPASTRVARAFLLRRGIRIFAGYWPVLLLTTVVFYVAGWSFTPDVNWFHSVWLTSIKLKQLAIPYSWSLTFELYFYLLFAAVLLQVPSRRLWCVLGFALLVAGLKWVLSHWFLIGYVNRLFYHPLMLEFLLGIGVWQLVMRQWPHGLWLVLYGLVLVLLASGVAQEYNILRRVLTTGVGCAGLLALACWLEQQGRVAPRWLVAWGDASYTVYLLHFLAISLVEQTGWVSWFMGASLWLCELAWWLFVVGFCLFCLLFFRAVERPLYRRLSRRMPRPVTVTLDAS